MSKLLDQEPYIPALLLEYYWGKDWPGLKEFTSDGIRIKQQGFPYWEQYSDDQKLEMIELIELCKRYTDEIIGIDEVDLKENENNIWSYPKVRNRLRQEMRNKNSNE